MNSWRMKLGGSMELVLALVISRVMNQLSIATTAKTINMVQMMLLKLPSAQLSVDKLAILPLRIATVEPPLVNARRVSQVQIVK